MIVRAELQRHFLRRVAQCFGRLFLLISSCLPFWVETACAQLVPVLKTQPSVDVRVVVDISGSMKKTDPDNLRRPAVQLAAEMIPEGAAAGVWTFGRFVNMLVPLKMVDNSWREQAKLAANRINSVGLYTNIPEALEKAAYGWSDPPGTTVRSLILLTDGKVDVSKSAAENARARQDVLSRLVPKLRATQAKVHTIAMSEDVDVELLRALSYETDGRFQTVQSRDDLVRVFVDAFDASVPAQQVPLDPSNRFNIDGGVKEFTLLVHKTANAKPTEIKTPSGRHYGMQTRPEGVRWFADPRLDVITVTEPEAGEWQLVASVDPDNRVTVISDLSLVLTGLPNNILKGEAITLDIHFKDKEGVVTNADFLRLVDLSFSQKYIDGNQVWQGNLSSYSEGAPKTPEDGRYKPRLEKSLLAGQHELTVLAEGRTFTRKVVQKITVLDQAVKVTFDAPTEVDMPFVVTVSPIAGLADKNLRVRAKVQAPDKMVKDVEMAPKAGQEDVPIWQGTFSPYGGAGIYRVIVQAVGTSPSGRPIDNKLGPFEAKMPETLLMGASEAQEIQLPFDNEAPVEINQSEPQPLDEPKPVDIDTQEKDALIDVEDDALLPDELGEDIDDVLDDDPDLAEIDEMDEAVTESEEEEAISDEAATDNTQSSALLKYGVWVAIGLINLLAVVFGFAMYRKAVRRRAEEEALEDARLAEVTQTDESAFGVSESADTSMSEELSGEMSGNFPDGIPDGMPDMPDMDDDDDFDDDDLDDAFDLSKTGNE